MSAATDYTSEIDGKTADEQLEECRRLYSLAYDYHYSWFSDVETDEAFRHGKQWSPEDLAYLKEQQRPALTFNVIGAKIAHLLGSAADNDVTAVLTPTGKRGQFLADTINKLLDEIGEAIDQASIEEQALESGVTVGIGHIAIDAFPDPEEPTNVKVTLSQPHALEVLWDPASEMKDRSDARYVCWMRWMSKSEFKAAYPEKASRADEIFAAYAGGADPFRRGPSSSLVQTSGGRDGYIDGMNRYWNEKTREICIVRLEMKRAERVTYATDGTRKRKIDPATKSLFAGRDDLETVDVWQDRVFWYEFCGTEMLFAEEAPVPFSNFSLCSWVYNQDERKMPYSLVRELRDPQREVNKRSSQMLTLILSQNAPGVFAEVGVFEDERQARESMKTPAGITWVQPGGIAGQKILQRQLPAFPEALARLTEMGLSMIDLISNVQVDDLTEPRGIPEAAATAQLKHRRGLLTMKPVLARYHRLKRQIATKIIETIVGSFPNRQILDILADDDRYTMEGRVIVDQETGDRADLASIRNVSARVRFEAADDNNTKRMLEQQSLMVLIQAGVPVDPSVIFDLLGLPDASKERLKDYAMATAKAAQSSEQAQLDQVREQMERDYQLDVAKATNQREKDIAKNRFSKAQSFMEFYTRMLDLWIKAEDNEKSRIVGMLGTLMSERTARMGMAQAAAPQQSTPMHAQPMEG